LTGTENTKVRSGNDPDYYNEGMDLKNRAGGVMVGLKCRNCEWCAAYFRPFTIGKNRESQVRGHLNTECWQRTVAGQRHLPDDDAYSRVGDQSKKVANIVLQEQRRNHRYLVIRRGDAKPMQQKHQSLSANTTYGESGANDAKENR
jgi:hypothetical protein